MIANENLLRSLLGTKRSSGRSPTEADQFAQLALFSRLSNEVLSRRAARRYDPESMTLAAKLLEQNPEVYTVWNYRREALKDTLQVSEEACLSHHQQCSLACTETTYFIAYSARPKELLSGHAGRAWARGS